MRIFRFDPEVSIPVTEFGSRFRIGPLTGPGSKVGVQVMHLAAGDLIGRHPARATQLFGVLAGSGWVAGTDGARRPIRSGYAALWDAGEEHGAGTDSGLTAICVEGEFEPHALAVTAEITVCDYNEAWPGWFKQLRARIWPALEDLAVRIDHVGSTAVPGLAAKPIIDMDIVVVSDDLIRPAIARLAGLGYRWRGDLGVTDRQAFAAPGGMNLPRHNLYLVVADSKPHLDHWLLRDLLRGDAEARERYAALKRRNAVLAEGDMDVYVSAKAALVAELLTRARAARGLPAATYWEP